MTPLFDDPKVSFEYLKIEGLMMLHGTKIPNELIRKIQELILNDNLSKKEYIRQFNELTSPYQSNISKLIVFFKNLKINYLQIIIVNPWKTMGVVVVFSVLVLYIRRYIKKNKRTRKRIKKILGVLYNIFERFGALCAYIVPLISIYTAYIPILVSTFPYLHFIVPDIMQDAMDSYTKHPWRINYVYFFGTLYAVTLFKFPKPRFIRFHLMRGLMLLAFQGIPSAFFQIFQSAETLTQYQIISSTLCVFAINLSWILPCLYQAVTYTYPRSSFIREAVEVNLGRDKDEGFRWWDR